MVEFSTKGLGELVFDSIREADTAVRGILYKNILLSGGTTMLPGFPDRLKKDIEDSWRTFVNRNPASEKTAPVNIIVDLAHQAPPRRHINVFSGATVFAQTARKKGPLSETMITKKEYDETGGSIVKRKAWSLTSVQ